MILYDQDFNFIGMSAETLTFLGYEDIDEFTSMHNDFADLFVKQEGFIHKFENFSWIHYVLYSGAANKKAHVMRKDGSQVCVDISIREVFLNHTYDGLRMLYSVKLINEGFTQISKTDVHDNRSPQSNEFSLRNLTQDSTIPDTTTISSMQEKPVEEATSVENTPPQPLDIKLDIPDSDIFKIDETPQTTETVQNEETPQTAPLDMNDFTLDLPPAQTPPAIEEPHEKEEEKPLFHLNLDQNEPVEETEETVSKETTPPPLFTLDEPEKENAMSLDLDVEVPQKSADEPKETENIFNFNLLKETDTQEESLPQSQPKTEEEKSEPLANLLKESEEKESDNEHNEPIFNFNLLSQSQENEEKSAPANTAHIEDEKPEMSLQEKLSLSAEPNEASQEPVEIKLFETDGTETKSAQSETMEEETPAAPQTPFSFNMFTTEEAQEDERVDDETKNRLIDQIKSDIDEIDQDIQPDTQEQKTASEKLQALMKQEEEQVHKDISLQDTTPQTETSSGVAEDKPLFTFDFLDEQKETPREQTQIQINTDNTDTIAYREESSFEETLKNIFTPEEKNGGFEEKNLNIFDPEKSSEKNKQPITKEDIKSPERNQDAGSETLEFPALGSLGLSKEEELDFIEEFLDDTASTITLMQEYLALEDYDNIKYNLIKISSSAEILHFEQMLNYTRELSQLCQSESKDAVYQKLSDLSRLTQQYKEHFSTITV